MKTKGQISIEAAMVLGLAVLLLVSLTNLHYERLSLARDVGGAGEGKMVGEVLAGAINNVYASGDGFSLYLDPGVINYTEIQEKVRITGMGVVLPLSIDRSNRTITISKNLSRTGGDLWNASVPILTENVTRLDPTALYPETTIRNNDSEILIYATSDHIEVVG